MGVCLPSRDDCAVDGLLDELEGLAAVTERGRKLNLLTAQPGVIGVFDFAVTYFWWKRKMVAKI